MFTSSKIEFVTLYFTRISFFARTTLQSPSLLVVELELVLVSGVKSQSLSLILSSSISCNTAIMCPTVPSDDILILLGNVNNSNVRSLLSSPTLISLLLPSNP